MTWLAKVLRLFLAMSVGLCSLLIISAALACYWLNQGRILSHSDSIDMGMSRVLAYVSAGEADKYTCRLTTKPGFPKARIISLKDVFDGKTVVFDSTWVCASSDDTVKGFFLIYADGGTVWQGTSSKRGELATNES